MNLRQAVFLLVLFVSYLLIGGGIFMQLEGEKLQTDNEAYEALLQFKDILLSNESRELFGVDEFVWAAHINFVFNNLTENEQYSYNQTVPSWSFYDATFFCLTVITTIGYGNKTPSTESSRGFTIVYALMGIPLTGIWMAVVGNFFSKKLLKAHEKTKNMSTRSPRLALIINTVTYLIPGFVIFLILPASIFMALEEWTFLDSLYYAVITLTTIGFGDLVAGQAEGEYKWMYKVLLMIWIIFGLGYLSMILNFIAKAMKSKHVKKLERRFTKNLRQTQEAFSKELDFLTKSLNEYMSKVKQVKSDDTASTLGRTASCPSMDGDGIVRSSLIESGREHAEMSANFIFDLAMAIACGEMERENNQTSKEHNAEAHHQPHNSNVAQLLTMALFPQLRGVAGGQENGNLTQQSQPPPSSDKHNKFFDLFARKKSVDDSELYKGKTTKSNSVAEGFLFGPFGGMGAFPPSSNSQPGGRQGRRQSEMVTSSSSNSNNSIDRNDSARIMVRNALKKHWESLNKDLKTHLKDGEDFKQSSERLSSDEMDGEHNEAVTSDDDSQSQQTHNNYPNGANRRPSTHHLEVIVESETNGDKKTKTKGTTVINMPK